MFISYENKNAARCPKNTTGFMRDMFAGFGLLTAESDNVNSAVNDRIKAKNLSAALITAVAVIILTVVSVAIDFGTGAYTANFPVSALDLTAQALIIGAGIYMLAMRASGTGEYFVYPFYVTLSIGMGLFGLSDGIAGEYSYVPTFALIAAAMPVLSWKKYALFQSVCCLPLFIMRAVSGTIALEEAAVVICGFFLSAFIKTGFIRMGIIREKNAEVNSRLTEESLTDNLTGIGNRGRFYKTLNENRDRWSDNSTEAAVIMMDIDDFKKYNDTYDHIEGDKCLKLVSKAVMSALREISGVECEFIRFGGEEFLALIAGDNISGCIQEIGVEANRAVSALKLSSGKGAAHPYVSLSMGAASFVFSDKTDIEREVERADEQLYYAKGSGKNIMYFDDKPIKVPVALIS